jgi:GAF domain-containing protein
VIRSRQTLVVRRGADDIYRRAFHFGQTENPVEHALFVPMLRDDRLIGVLSVQRYDLLPYHADDIRTVETIAHQSAAALAHARLFAAVARARDAAERHAADLRAVLSVSRAIASAADLDAMLATLAAETRALVPHDRLALYRVLDGGGGLELVLSRGGDEATTPRQVPRDFGPIGHVFQTGEPALIEPQAEGDESLYAALAPLIVGGRIGGVLQLSRNGGRPFSEQELRSSASSPSTRPSRSATRNCAPATATSIWPGYGR